MTIRASCIVIVGAGMAGYQLATSLRERGHDGRIVLIGQEAQLPYQRPPLSKDFLRSDGGHETVALRPHAFFDAQRIEVLTGIEVREIRRDLRQLRLSDARTLSYDHLVLATGARAKPWPVPGGVPSRMLSLRSFEDALCCRELLRNPGALVILGGGFIGLELAAAATKAGHKVTIVESANRLLSRSMSQGLAEYVRQRHEAEGVEVLTGIGVHAFHAAEGKLCAVELIGGRSLETHAAVIGIGALPNDGLAREAGLEVNDGIVVDAQLVTTRDSRISAIGDCANFPSPHAQSNVRLESVQNAMDQARFVAARLLRGGVESYAAVPWFWTHQYDMRIQIAGLGRACDECLTIGDQASGFFSVLRFGANGRMRCVESVNSPPEHIAARKILSMPLVPTLGEAQSASFSLRDWLAGAT